MVAIYRNIARTPAHSFIADALGLAAIVVIILGGLFLPVVA